MFEWSKALLRTLLFFLICVFLGIVLLMFILSEGMFMLLMVPVLFLVLTVVAFILTFIPFFEGKLWLIPAIEILVAVIFALLAHFIFI